jgi:hypothetical protein
VTTVAEAEEIAKTHRATRAASNLLEWSGDLFMGILVKSVCNLEFYGLTSLFCADGNVCVINETHGQYDFHIDYSDCVLYTNWNPPESRRDSGRLQKNSPEKTSNSAGLARLSLGCATESAFGEALPVPDANLLENSPAIRHLRQAHHSSMKRKRPSLGEKDGCIQP